MPIASVVMAHYKIKRKNMKRIFLGCIICSFGLATLAQNELITSCNNKTIGKNYLTNKNIVAKEIVFPERIHDFYFDTLSNCITVQLRGTSKNGKWLNNGGNVVLYDLGQNKVKWYKKIYYQQGGIEQHNNLIIHTIQNKSYCLSSKTGDNLWEVKNSIYIVEPNQNIGIGYKYDTFSGEANTLEGINLKDGKIVWQRKINREYSWNDLIHINDSTILLVAAGLHTINIKNGTGWDYNTITGQKDYTTNVAANVAGAALGLLTGTFVGTTGHDLIRDVVSNLLVDSTNIYIASREKLTRLNHKGDIIWSTPLDKSSMSKSSIFVRDSTLFMVNKGYAFMGNRQLDYGNPFFSAFNLKSGKQKFLNRINKENEQISFFQTDKDTLLVISKNKISKFNMNDGSLKDEKIFDIETSGELKFLVGNNVYIKSDSTYCSLVSSDTKNYFVYTKNADILEINRNLQISNQISSNNYYVYYFKNAGCKFLDMGKTTTVIDKNDKEIATLDISRKTIKIGSKIYYIQENSLIEVDLNDITQK